MQERKKRRIVIASILKPVDDTRMFEKIGQTLAARHEVHIIGYPSRTPGTPSNVSWHALPSFKRVSWSRAFIAARIFRTIITLRPDTLIITTHELLLVAVLVKVFRRTKVIYDIQENYYRNLLHTTAYPFLLRAPLAIYVRSMEWITSPFVDHFFLAERGYESEITFPSKEKTTVLANKYKRPASQTNVPRNVTGELNFLFSGTLAESTGLFLAIDVVSQFAQLEKGITLTIIGYCARRDTLVRLHSIIKGKPFVRLIGGNELVPHTDILREFERAQVGIISYPPNPSTENAMPTKLYEYLACELPILLIDHPPWNEQCAPFNAAVTFQPATFNAAEVLRQIRQKSFYSSKPEGIFWETEATKLLSVVD